jgi:hypothetical protein
MGDDDLDRAAILARRQRFIALALSGLACTSTDPPPRDAKPQACLKYSVEPRQPKPDPPREAVPGPCLAMPIDGEFGRPKIPETDTANPNACLSIAPPQDPTAGAAPCLSAVPPKAKPPASKPPEEPE